MTPVDTKKVTNRRTVKFATLGDIVADVEQLGDNVRGEGNWTPAQNVGHVATLVELSLDGFPPTIKAPLPLRLLGPLFKGRALRKTLSAVASIRWTRSSTHKIERLTSIPGQRSLIPTASSQGA